MQTKPENGKIRGRHVIMFAFCGNLVNGMFKKHEIFLNSLMFSTSLYCFIFAFFILLSPLGGELHIIAYN